MISIVGPVIRSEEPPCIVAEMAGNHESDISPTCRIQDATRVVRADIVGIQIDRTGAVTTDRTGVRSIRPGNGFRSAYHEQLTNRIGSRGIEFGERVDTVMITGGLVP